MKCCNKEMKKTPIQDLLGDVDGFEWVCLECGSYHKEIDGQLDEEELENYKNNMRVITNEIRDR